jgi:predicted ester cyclase/heme-degrading monooxygenase HmoA
MSVIKFLLVILLIPGLGISQETENNETNSKSGEVSMTVLTSNREVVRKIYEECLNKRNTDLLQELVSADYIGVSGETGAKAFEVAVAGLFRTSPDIQWVIEELVGEGDKVCIKWKLKGTQTGEFLNFPATGKEFTNSGMAVYELKEGKVVKAEVLTDRLGFLQSIEVLPEDLSLLAGEKEHKNRIFFIDKFSVPGNAKQEFLTRLTINRTFIRKLPGFIEDAAYERTDEKGNTVYITIAVWEDQEALKNAKTAVNAEYEKQGFNVSEMLERLDITLDRGIYKPTVP